MFGIDASEMARQHGLLFFFLPLVPSVAAALGALLIVRPAQRGHMLLVSLATTFGSFGTAAALLPLMDNILPREFLPWEGHFILFLPVLVTLAVAFSLRAHGASVAGGARAGA